MTADLDTSTKEKHIQPIYQEVLVQTSEYAPTFEGFFSVAHALQFHFTSSQCALTHAHLNPPRPIIDGLNPYVWSRDTFPVLQRKSLIFGS